MRRGSRTVPPSISGTPERKMLNVKHVSVPQGVPKEFSAEHRRESKIIIQIFVYLTGSELDQSLL